MAAKVGHGKAYQCLRSVPKGVALESGGNLLKLDGNNANKSKRIHVSEVEFGGRRRSTSAPDPREVPLEITKKIIEFSAFNRLSQDSDPLPRRYAVEQRSSVKVTEVNGREEGEFEWKISEEQRKMWREEFKQKVGGLFINTTHVQRLFFKGGKLNDDQLGIICCLADATGDGKLDCDEFIVFRFLVHAAEQGQNIPTPLPSSLFLEEPPTLNREMRQDSYTFALGETYGRPGTPKIQSPRLDDKKEEEFVKPPLSRVSSLALFLTNLEEKTTEAKESNTFELYVKQGNQDVNIERGQNGEVVVKSGTIDGLIKCLASEQHLVYGQEYSEILIFTHQHFIESCYFLNRLSTEFKHSILEEKRSPSEKKIFTIYRLRIINFIRKWIETSNNDFEEGKELRDNLDQFIIYLYESKTEGFPQCAKILSKALYPNSIAPALMGDPKSPRKMKLLEFSKGCQFMDIPLEELAKQMTLYDHKILKEIPLNQLLSKKWLDSPPCIRFAKRMEHVTYWVASEIVSTSNLKTRVMVLSSFIKLMELFLGMRNFYSLMAVYLALSLLAIERLGKTWKGLPSRHIVVWDKIKTLMDPSNNFMNYRKLWISSELPKIPTPTVFLKDLTFIEDGNPDTNENGMINFDKLVMLGRCISQVKASQDCEYSYQIQPRVQKYLIKEMIAMNPADILQSSKNCESSKESPDIRSSITPTTKRSHPDRSSLFG